MLHVAGLADRQVTLNIQGDEVTIAEVAGGAAAHAAAEAAYAHQQNGFQVCGTSRDEMHALFLALCLPAPGSRAVIPWHVHRAFMTSVLVSATEFS